jgi:hypothetical protein
MSKTFKLKVAKPCHEDWQNMSPNAKGRHCQSCAKTVVDFSIMTDAEIVSFFKNKPQNVCGRFTDKQLEKHYSIATPSQSMNYARAAALAAGLFVASVGCEKIPSLSEKDSLIQVDSNNKFPKNFRIIKGIVEGDSTHSLMGVVITVDGSLQKTFSDINGKFELIVNIDSSNLNIHFAYGENDFKTEYVNLKTYNFEEDLKVVMFSDFSTIVSLKKCSDSSNYIHVIMGDVNTNYIR